MDFQKRILGLATVKSSVDPERLINVGILGLVSGLELIFHVRVKALQIL